MPCLRPSEIRKDGGARPHLAHEGGAIRILHKVIARNSRVVRRVAGIRLPGDVQICDDNELVLLARKIFYQPSEIRECLLIYSERPVFVLEVDIEPKNVGGNAVFAQPCSDFLSCDSGK